MESQGNSREYVPEEVREKNKALKHSEKNKTGNKQKKWLKDLNFWFTNADTLTNKVEEFECRIRNSKPHIAHVSEVLPKNFDKVKNKIHKEFFEIEGYDMIPHQNVIDNTGRGSILYTRKDLIGQK